MNGWKKIPIGELVEAVKSWNPLRSISGEVFNYIDLSAVDQSTKIIIGARETICSEAPSRARQLITTGDILVSTVRPNLNAIAMVAAEYDGATASTGFCILRPRSSSLSSNYLFHWVKSPQFVSDMVSKATGASYPAVSDRIIRESLIPIPTLAEQRRIAAILDQVDALRTKRRETLAQLDTLTQSIFIEMFGDSVINSKSWPVVGIDEVCELIIDCVNRTAPVVEGPTPYKMIRTTNVKAGKVNLSEVRYVTEATFKLWNRRTTPKAGDVLLTREAPLGEAGILEGNDKVFLGQRLMLYRADIQRIVPQYLLSSFQSGLLKNQFEKHSSGSTVKHLSLPACRSFRVLLPPVKLQNEFAERITVLENLKVHQRAALTNLDKLFVSIQNRAFRGEL